MVRDLYAERDLGVVSGSYTGEVDIHDVAALRITPLEAVAGADSWRPWLGQPIYAAEEQEGEAGVRAAGFRAALGAVRQGKEAGEEARSERRRRRRSAGRRAGEPGSFTAS